jgi:hypothetical protein
MSDWLEAVKHSWWVVMVLPIKIAWRHLWRMLIFATKPDLFERVSQAYDWEHNRRMEVETENERLRIALAGLIDSSSRERAGHSTRETTDQ